MHWAFALAVLATLALAESAPTEAVGGAEYRLLATLGGITLVALFATAAAGVTTLGLRRDFSRRRDLMARFARLRAVHLALWLAVVLTIEYGLAWSRVVRVDWGLGDAFLVDELLILAPAILALLLSWAAFYEVDRTVRLARAAAQAEPATVWSRGGYLLFQARHQLGLLLVPLTLFLALYDGVNLWRPSLVDSPSGAMIFALPAIALFAMFPLLLRHVWWTEPLPDGPLRERLESTAAQCGFQLREILVWRTEGLIANAAVSGLVARLRYVFLSDLLLAQLTDDELTAVFAHELGHLRHRHLLKRGLVVLAPLAVWWILSYWAPDLAAQIAAWPAALGLEDELLGSLATLAALGGTLVIGLGLYSRQLEHEADLFAMSAFRPPATSEEAAAHPFVSALEKLAALHGRSREAGSWQHASIARRVEFFERAAVDPARAERFRGFLRFGGAMLSLIALAGLAAQALSALSGAGIV